MSKQVSNSQLIEFFRSESSLKCGPTAAAYLKAVNSLAAYADISPENCPVASAEFLNNWIVAMNRNGISLNTASHYVNVIAALYSKAVEAGVAEKSDCFTTVKTNLKLFGSDIWKGAIADEHFSRFILFLKNGSRLKGDDRVYADVALFSIINRAMSVESVAMLKRDDLADFDEASAEIADRHCAATRKYVFPLRQSVLTPKQLAADLCLRISKLMSDRGIAIAGDANHTIRSYWAFAALKVGASGSMALQMCGGTPSGLPVLKLCGGNAAADVSPEAVARLTQAVNGIFLTNPMRWFAMRMRPGVKFKQLETRIKASADMQLELFYPLEEIARRKGNKIVWASKPIISDIVFFKSRYTDVQPLFAAIGDAAWCYKSGGVYASIPDAEMKKFQYAIGKFTSETEIYPLGTIPLEKNDRVEIIGGPFSGYTATYDSTRYEDEGGETPARVVYRLIMPSGNGMEWVLDMDPWQVKKLNLN